MSTLTIKNLPEDLYHMLKQNAIRHHRSLNGEAIAVLERGLIGERMSKEQILTSAREIRQKIKGIYVTEKTLAKAKRAGRE